MRFLQTGDLHVGRGRSSWGETVSLQRSFQLFDRIYRAAVDEKVHAVLITGDVFDTKAVTNKERELVTRKLTQYASQIPTFVIPGNHDLLTKTASNLDFLAEITENTSEIPNLHVAFAHRESVWEFPTGNAPGGLFVVGLPATLSEDQTKIEYISANLPKDCQHIVMGHSTISGCVRNDSNWRPSEAEDQSRVSLARASQNAQVVFWSFGDIHRRQKLPTLPESAKGCYAGSPIQMDFGETTDRGCTVVALDWDEKRKWHYKGQRYVRLDEDFAPLITVLKEEDIDSLPKDALIRLGAGLVLPASRHKQIVSTLKVVDDRSTPEAAIDAAGTTADGEVKPLEVFDPLLADISLVESTVLDGLPDGAVALAEAKKVVASAVERYRARTYVS